MNNIVDLNKSEKFRGQQLPPLHERGIIKENEVEGNTMEKNFITEKDLRLSEEKTDLKLKNLEDRMDANFKNLNDKIDSKAELIVSEMEKLIMSQQIKSNEESKKDRKWLVGIVISLVAIAVPVLMSTLKAFIQ